MNLRWWDNDLINPPPNEGQATWYMESPSGQSLIPGQVYRVYLHVRQGRSSAEIATRQVLVRYGASPRKPPRNLDVTRPQTKTFKLGNAGQIDAFLMAAQDKGYKFAYQGTDPGTTCRTETFRFLWTKSGSPFLNTKVTCRYEYFQRGDQR